MNRDCLVVDSQTLWDRINVSARLPAHGRVHEHVMRQPVIGTHESYRQLTGATHCGLGTLDAGEGP